MSARVPSFRKLLGLAAALTGVLAAVPARAGLAVPEELSCEAAGSVAERDWSLPSGLLAAIGRVESGRRDAFGRNLAWPWTINAAGQGYYFASKDEAMRAVVALQAQGVRSIDVGCYQINLMHHPYAFASLQEAFDPRANALYAGRFLTSLQQRTGSWEGAIGAYHSGTPGLGEAYRARVLAAWSGGPSPGVRLPSGGILIPVAAALPTPALSPPALAAPANAGAIRAGGAMVWTVAAQSMGVRVWTAGNAGAGTLPTVHTGAPPKRAAWP